MALDPSIDPVVGDDLGSAEVAWPASTSLRSASWAREGTSRPAGAPAGATRSRVASGGRWPSTPPTRRRRRRCGGSRTPSPPAQLGEAPATQVVALDSELGEESTAYVEQYPRDGDGRSYQVSPWATPCCSTDLLCLPAKASSRRRPRSPTCRRGPRYVVAAMCVFAADQCVAVEKSPVTPDGSGDVPEDFPLAAGWPDDADASRATPTASKVQSTSLPPFNQIACSASAPIPSNTRCCGRRGTTRGLPLPGAVRLRGLHQPPRLRDRDGGLLLRLPGRGDQRELSRPIARSRTPASARSRSR